MSQPEIFEKVKTIIIGRTGIHGEGRITEAAKLNEDLIFDSLDRVEVLMDVEDEFDISLSDEEAEGFTTVGDIVEYVAGKVG